MLEQDREIGHLAAIHSMSAGSSSAQRLRRPQHGKKGFTLIELSIVLVVIGLIVGGVLVGRDLIHAAEIRQQISQIQEYEVAYTTFQTKYNCVPGDCINATQYFTGVTNGNGNELIQAFSYNTGTYVPYDNNPGFSQYGWSPEFRYFFIELEQANLIKGHFIDGSITPDVGLPAPKLNPKMGFFAGDSSNFVAAGRNPDIAAYKKGSNALWFVACTLTSQEMYTWDDHWWETGYGMFFASDLSSIDTKMDDGLPLSGRMLGFGGNHQENQCLNGSNYDVLSTIKQCQMAYVLD